MPHRLVAERGFGPCPGSSGPRRVAGRAQRNGAEPDGGREGAPGPAGGVLGVVAAPGDVNRSLTAGASHDAARWAAARSVVAVMGDCGWRHPCWWSG